MRVSAAILVASMVAAAPAYADNGQVRRVPVPNRVVPTELIQVSESPGGMVFVRRSETQVHVDGQGQAQYSGYRMYDAWIFGQNH